jgi:hypothetical protein
MKYAVQMGSGTIIYIPSFINIDSGIQKLIGRDTHRQQGDLISLLLFFQNKESRLKSIFLLMNAAICGVPWYMIKQKQMMQQNSCTTQPKIIFTMLLIKIILPILGTLCVIIRRPPILR